LKSIEGGDKIRRTSRINHQKKKRGKKGREREKNRSELEPVGTNMDALKKKKTKKKKTKPRRNNKS